MAHRQEVMKFRQRGRAYLGRLVSDGSTISRADPGAIPNGHARTSESVAKVGGL
jgi:hypothetical protein